jgi:error-prone DNA polymerase
MALTDLESVGGAVRAHVAARDAVRCLSQLAEAPDVRQESPPLDGLRLAQFRIAHGARVRLAIGDEGEPVPPLDMLLYASDRASWAALCRLLTRARTAGSVGLPEAGGDAAAACGSDALRSPVVGRAQRSKAQRMACLRLHDLVELLAVKSPARCGHAASGEGLLGVLLPPRIPSQRFFEAGGGLAHFMPDRLAVALMRVDEPGGVAHAECAVALSEALRLPLAAVNDIRMHDPSRRPLLDVLACIRAGTDIDRAGHLLSWNAERRLRPPEEVFRRYSDRPDALDTAWRFLERASAFSLDELRYGYPREIAPEGRTPMEHLRTLVLLGARERYPCGVPIKVTRQIEHELAIIADLDYAPYFLTVQDIVAFARSRGILCQGRGAAANSAVCYALGVTAVDPDRIDVLFERFVSRERNEPPDIDIDFEHERREEVIQYIYAKYGRDRAALVCEVVSYRSRSAIRDVGKALGLPLDAVDRLARSVDRWSGGGLGQRDDVDAAGDARARLHAAGLDPDAPRVRMLAHLSNEILGFPRNRSQHVGGFVISETPLCETVPIEHASMDGRTVIEWDKDDIDALGMLKIDILALGMLTALRKSIDLVNGDRTALADGASAQPAHDAPRVRADFAESRPSATGSASLVPSAGTMAHSAEPLRFHAIPAEDPATYDMICRADTVGVFQIESRAQMSMLPRLRPRCFYDLVIEVAIVRPGPIQGDMVHPYLRRRSGIEKPIYPDEAVRGVLGRTLGVPLFQEQAMALAVVAAGFTPGQADELRRAIAAWKRSGNQIALFRAALEDGMVARGYSQAFAQQVFEQVKGFSGYGFPESHAASFALLVYASAWIKRHHPAAFVAALLNSQPMGFYAPAQLVRDAQDHGVAIRAVDILCSLWDTTLERGVDPVSFLASGGASGSAGTHDPLCAPRLQPLVRIRAGDGPPEVERLSSVGGAIRWRVPAAAPSACAAHHTGDQRPAEPLCAPAEHSRASSTVQGDRDARSGQGAAAHAHFLVPSQAAVRLGLHMVRGLCAEEASRLVEAVRRHGPFQRLSDLSEASGVGAPTLRGLAAADAFRSMGLDRQQASWQILALRDRVRPLWSFGNRLEEAESMPSATPPTETGSSVEPPAVAGADWSEGVEPALPPEPELVQIASDLAQTGVSLRRHPILCIRHSLQRLGAVPCSWLRHPDRTPAGRRLTVAGIVLLRQSPSTAKGIVFMTIEDESGSANLILRPKTYVRLRSEVRAASLLVVRGKVERRDGVVHVLVESARDLTARLTEGLRPP